MSALPDLDAFAASLAAAAPPPGLPAPLRALWHEAKGDWARAHALAQEDGGAAGSWVHAYLHRREGDAANAAYWYRRAGRKPGALPPGDEWREISGALLAGAKAEAA